VLVKMGNKDTLDCLSSVEVNPDSSVTIVGTKGIRLYLDVEETKILVRKIVAESFLRGMKALGVIELKSLSEESR